MAAPAPPTNPGEAFGAGDPRNALYFSNLAALEHQKANSLSGIAEQRNLARANTKYGEGQLTQHEPGSYKANAHRANQGGILESGVNAERRGTIGSEYANKRYQLTHGLQENEGRFNKGEQEANTRFADEKANIGNKALAEGYSALLNNPPNELGAVNPAGVRTITGPPEAGNVVPYTEKIPGVGSVAVGSATRYAREQAAKKAKEGK
jgi:hypothetical protein